MAAHRALRTADPDRHTSTDSRSGRWPPDREAQADIRRCRLGAGLMDKLGDRYSTTSNVLPLHTWSGLVSAGGMWAQSTTYHPASSRTNSATSFPESATIQASKVLAAEILMFSTMSVPTGKAATSDSNEAMSLNPKTPSWFSVSLWLSRVKVMPPVSISSGPSYCRSCRRIRRQDQPRSPRRDQPRNSPPTNRCTRSQLRRSMLRRFSTRVCCVAAFRRCSCSTRLAVSNRRSDRNPQPPNRPPAEELSDHTVCDSAYPSRCLGGRSRPFRSRAAGGQHLPHLASAR